MFHKLESYFRRVTSLTDLTRKKIRMRVLADSRVLPLTTVLVVSRYETYSEESSSRTAVEEFTNQLSTRNMSLLFLVYSIAAEAER